MDRNQWIRRVVQFNHYLQEFSKTFFPVFIYDVADIRLQKTIATVYGQNTTLILYNVLKAPASFVLELRPFVAGRDYHSLVRANSAVRKDFSCQEEILCVRPYETTPNRFSPAIIGLPIGDGIP
ncbi:MAG: glycogen debranching enzyme N-terminal domain-containing protein [Desulfobacterales bacterium]